MRYALISVAIVAPGLAHAAGRDDAGYPPAPRQSADRGTGDANDLRTSEAKERPSQKKDERTAEAKKEQAEKKGALKERVDPARDLKLQRENVQQLRRNAETERHNGNRIGAWAAENDAKHAEKLMQKDEKLLREGRSKKQVDDQKVKQ